MTGLRARWRQTPTWLRVGGLLAVPGLILAGVGMEQALRADAPPIVAATPRVVYPDAPGGTSGSAASPGTGRTGAAGVPSPASDAAKRRPTGDSGGAPAGGPDAGSGPDAILESRAVAQVDPGWATETATATGIPRRALIAYAAAELTVAAETPTCDLGWNTIAAVGAVESDHGSHGHSTITPAGLVQPPILGPALDGREYDRIPDTDGGALDGDREFDRAVGPMQIIPATWQRWGSDGNGDGRADPQHIDDAALTAARYLCASGSMSDPESWRRAVLSYNNLAVYADDIAATANEYAARAARK